MLYNPAPRNLGDVKNEKGSVSGEDSDVKNEEQEDSVHDEVEADSGEDEVEADFGD